MFLDTTGDDSVGSRVEFCARIYTKQTLLSPIFNMNQLFDGLGINFYLFIKKIYSLAFSSIEQTLPCTLTLSITRREMLAVFCEVRGSFRMAKRLAHRPKVVLKQIFEFQSDLPWHF